MKKTLLLIGKSLVALSMVSMLASCEEEKDDPIVDPPVEEENVIQVKSNITTNTTWKTGKTYVLTTRIVVVEPAELTIEPGVIVKGEVGAGANATVLVIAQGAKINAQGTASQPIIFTTISDEIQPGEIASPNLDASFNGLWGGLIVLGKAPISVKGDAETWRIEGIPDTEPHGIYGGTVADDNSGVIRYVSVRHGGTLIGEGNEINGITLGGVGSGTTIEYIEVIGNKDDGIEWFGGTVNVTNALVWSPKDDAIDTDQAWSGTLDNFIIIGAGDKCFELDGPEGTVATADKHSIINGSVKADGAVGLVDLDKKGNAQSSYLDMENILFFDVTEGQTFDEIPVFYDTYEGCTFANFEIVLPTGDVLTDYFKDGSDAFAAAVDTVSVATVGADKSQFAGWTMADQNGMLSDF